MTIKDRLIQLKYYCGLIKDTSSLIYKRALINSIPDELKDDFEFILECLAGKHKLGYKFIRRNYGEGSYIRGVENRELTLREYCEPLFNLSDLSNYQIDAAHYCCPIEQEFLASFLNRELKLGIGTSLLPKEETAPMLAKKYEGCLKPDKNGYYLTEKLDGNRCIARYNNTTGKWEFLSRNGKLMHVNFDMFLLPKEFVYDGEVLSVQQTLNSCLRANNNFNMINVKDNFNVTSGTINKHSLDKQLIYNIFDIQIDDAYCNRRKMLNSLEQKIFDTEHCDIRILPARHIIEDVHEIASNMLDNIVKSGGEGVMINYGSASYSHKRTDQLLKYKKVQTMDMLVTDILDGSGKYKGMVGAIECIAMGKDGTTCMCQVGSGIEDWQRQTWADFPDSIIGKVVEVEYFSLSQNKSTDGTSVYSLRFPRLKRIRTDKTKPSLY